MLPGEEDEFRPPEHVGRCGKDRTRTGIGALRCVPEFLLRPVPASQSLGLGEWTGGSVAMRMEPGAS